MVSVQPSPKSYSYFIFLLGRVKISSMEIDGELWGVMPLTEAQRRGVWI